MSGRGVAWRTLGAVLVAGTLQAAPPALVLEDGGIEFPDGTLQETSATAPPPSSLEVAVNCTLGESINEALQVPAEELTVAINGVCNEDVIIRRDDVTLLGTSPAASGIHYGGTPNEPGLAVVRIWNADGVRLENLSVTGGVRHGVLAGNSTVTIDNCEVTGHARFGFAAWWGSDVTGEGSTFSDNGEWGYVAANGNGNLTDLTVSGNTAGGMALAAGSALNCTSCVVSGNGTDQWAVLSTEASHGYFYDSAISGDGGVWAEMSGFVLGQDTPVTATSWALYSSEQRDINWYATADPVQISGRILVDWKGFLWASGVEQATNPGSNVVLKDSTLFLQSSTLLGLDNDTFANGEVQGSNLGDVTCANGSDLFCDGSSTVTSSSCGLCPVAASLRSPSGRARGSRGLDGMKRRRVPRTPAWRGPGRHGDGELRPPGPSLRDRYR
jgi:hypothetical protein